MTPVRPEQLLTEGLGMTALRAHCDCMKQVDSSCCRKSFVAPCMEHVLGPVAGDGMGQEAEPTFLKMLALRMRTM